MISFSPLGTHHELLDKNGIYKKLVLRQLSKGALDANPALPSEDINVDLFESIEEDEEEEKEEEVAGSGLLVDVGGETGEAGETMADVESASETSVVA